ncbi:MAG: helix-turn-helix domain-containing protein [Planctomycetes bacterium]|jgi:hypothetical protein|nr:helix-turn-helix domain-containing protein [Planctomycetota bacterium]
MVKAKEEKTNKVIEPETTIWLSVSEASKIGGVQTKTIRRAIKAGAELRYQIINNRYLIDLRSLILFLHKNIKLENKLHQKGVGQYIEKWKDLNN